MDDYIKSLSKNIINSFKEVKNSNPVIKKEVGLELEIEPEYQAIRLNPKVGIEKKYIIRTKLRDFLDSYANKNNPFTFGAKFTYNPDEHYFNKKNEEILDFILEQSHIRSNISDSLYLPTDRMKAFFNIIKDYPFFLHGHGMIYGIKEGNPFIFTLNKSNDLYTLNLEDNDAKFLHGSNEYVSHDHYLYHLSSEYQKLFSLINPRSINKLIFDKKELNSFKNKLLPVIKNNLEIDKSVDNIVISKRPECSLYFDLNYNDIICNLKLNYNGTGLNLTSADVVIHLDLWWNPQAENQATDRAHRIGQKNNVEVIKLVSKGTIEEKILNLQEKKKMLSDKVIEGEDMDKNMLSKLTEKELKDLLSYENEETVKN